MSTSPVDIAFDLTDPKVLERLMRSIADETDRAGRSVDDLGKRVARVRGPYTNLDRRMSEMHAGVAGGVGGAQLQDLVYNARKAQERVLKMESAGTSPLRRALGNAARVPMSAGGAAYQALSVVGAIGPEGKIAELFGRAALDAAAAIKGLADNVAATSREFSAFRAGTGATGAESAMAAAMGIDAGMASGVRERALSNPYAYATAARLGVNYLPGAAGMQQDTGGAMLQILDAIRKEDAAQQRMDLRMFGLEGFAGVMRVGKGTWDQLKSDSQLSAKVFSDMADRIGGEYMASQMRLDMAKKNAATALGAPVVTDMTTLQNNGASLMNNIAKGAALHPDAVRVMVGLTRHIVAPFWLNALLDAQGGEFAGRDSGGRGEDPQTRATNRNTEATEKLNMAISSLGSGNVGYGERFESAIPPGMRWSPSIHAAARAGALRMGALG